MTDLRTRTQTETESQAQYVGTYCVLPTFFHSTRNYQNADHIKDGAACSIPVMYLH